MRQSYISERQPETNQAQQFFNTKDHYICKISEIIEQYLKERFHSKRRNILRGIKKSRIILQINCEEGNFASSESEIESQPSKSINLQTIDKKLGNLNSCLTMNQRKQKYKSALNQSFKNSGKNLVVHRKYAKRYIHKFKQSKENQQINIYNRNLLETTQKFKEPFESGVCFTYFYTELKMDVVMRKVKYHPKVLSFFTQMFKQTLAAVKKETSAVNKEGIAGSKKKIQNYRRQKDFLKTIKITF